MNPITEMEWKKKNAPLLAWLEDKRMITEGQDECSTCEGEGFIICPDCGWDGVGRNGKPVASDVYKWCVRRDQEKLRVYKAGEKIKPWVGSPVNKMLRDYDNR